MMTTALCNLHQSWVKGILSPKHRSLLPPNTAPSWTEALPPQNTDHAHAQREDQLSRADDFPTLAVLWELLESQLAYPLCPQGPGVADANSLTGRLAFQKSWTAPRLEETVQGLCLLPSNSLGLVQAIGK